MKKSILNLGKNLSKLEQKAINGGKRYCNTIADCPPGNCCMHNACLPETHFLCRWISL
ncbi:hypothetical protein [uncultured Tenacibaculum sp.]|uniref:hypothetical protein n=1 Tax=uncultured Tenacibaculum sp. TaxID=174713 RepID=UPI002629EF73|nr:hypothetical protein [uncultured Tenacibaculum sp.]